jgi:hypothetical protein
MIGAISQACSLPVTTASDAEYISLARVNCMQSAPPTQIALARTDISTTTG